MDEQPTKQARILGLSRFDLLIATVVLILVVSIAAVSYLSNPERKGALIAYLYPLSSAELQETTIPNIWLAPVSNPEDAQPLTDSAVGIFDFGVSPDGRFIAYSERDSDSRLLEIYLLDLQIGNREQLTDCGVQDADCYTPIFHPSGNTFAYMRQSINRDLANVQPGVPRIWLYDLPSRSTMPLAQESQELGHSPVWSADGNTLAYFSSDVTNPGILIYNFNPQTSDTPTLNFVPSSYGTTGTLSPNGRKLIFPDLVNREGLYQAHLRIVDLNANPPTYTNFTEREGANDDIAAQYHPDGAFVAIARRYSDDRWTQGYQLYLVDEGEVVPLLYDTAYSHHYFAWNQTGDKLVVQRLEINQPSARPEIWVLDYLTGDLTRISERAFHPRWVLP